jgi:hypothetical protein
MDNNGKLRLTRRPIVIGRRRIIVLKYEVNTKDQGRGDYRC